MLVSILERGVPCRPAFQPNSDDPGGFAASLRTFVWWSVLLDLLIVASLWLSLRRWLGSPPRPGGENEQCDSLAAPRGPSRWQILSSALLAATVLACIAAPRLSESLWNDELWSLRESIHGGWDRDLETHSPEDVLTEIYWHPIGWEHAIWRYETTNHHFLLNIMAKAGLAVWQWSTGAEEWEFDEVALRFLPFLCALSGLVAWAMFFYRLGFPVAAAILPWLLALHPWYQQHSTAMRAYPLIFLFLPLALHWALRALRSGEWRYWMGFAACQFLFVYSWPAGAAILVVFNPCLAVATWRRWKGSAARPDQLKRWAIANLATLMVLLPLISPGVFQIGPYLESDIVRSDMRWPWLRDLACLWLVGAHWPDLAGYSARSGLHVTGELLFREHPVLFLSVCCATLIFLAWGGLRLFSRCPREARLFTFGLLLPPLIIYLKAVTAAGGEDVYLFHWYFLYALPFLAGIAAIGIASIVAKIAGPPSGRRGLRLLRGVATIILALGAYTALALPRTAALLHGSVDPRRESARAIRGDLRLTDPANARILTAHVFRSALGYDPLGWVVKAASNAGLPDGSPPGLTQLMRLADTHDLTLYVNIGYPSEAKKKYPDLMEVIDTSGFFELHSRHFGLEPQFERAVYRYRGGLFDFDFDRPKS